MHFIIHIGQLHHANFFSIFSPVFYCDSRNKVKYLNYLRKRCNVNPARGPFHFRAPCRIFYKAVRGNAIFFHSDNVQCSFSFMCDKLDILSWKKNALNFMMNPLSYLHYMINHDMYTPFSTLNFLTSQIS